MQKNFGHVSLSSSLSVKSHRALPDACNVVVVTLETVVGCTMADN